MPDRRTSHPLRQILILGTLLTACAFLLVPTRAFAQAEHVEISHPVYQFLNRMQVRGLIPEYSRSMLPLERKEVTGLIRKLATEEAGLSGAERELIWRFADEFVAEAEGSQDAVLIFETPISELPGKAFSDREKYLYQWRSADGENTFAAEFLAKLEYRTLMDADKASNVMLGEVGGRFRGTLGGVVGYGLRATNGMVSGDRSLALNDQQLRRNFNFADLDKSFFDFSEAYIGATWEWGSASLGKENRIIGSGVSNQILLSTNAQPFDAIQLSAHVGKVRFMFLHGFLLSEKQVLDEGRPYYDAKYVAMHRAEADLFNAIRFGVFESIVYSRREVDPAYLNPVNFYKSAEHAGGDRDNPMLGFDLATLFIPGSQIYGTWLMDDVDFSLLGSGWWGNKFIWQGGLLNSSLLPNTDIALEYTRIEPYVYTHRLSGNQYTHNGDALGLEIPPNSDEWYGSLRHWISADFWLQLEYHHRRHGRNELDDEGNVLINHGADIFQSLDYERDSDISPFLDGPLDTSDMLTLTLRWEPWRNLILAGQYRYRDLRSDTDGDRTEHYMGAGVWIEF